MHLKVFFGIEKGRGGCCVHFSVYFVASLGGGCVGLVMRSLWERFTTPVREGTKGADKSGVMEQHAKKDFKIQGRKKGPWIGGKSGTRGDNLPESLQGQRVHVSRIENPPLPPKSVLTVQRLPPRAGPRKKIARVTTLTLGVKGGVCFQNNQLSCFVLRRHILEVRPV